MIHLNDYMALAGGVLLAGIGGEFFLRGLVDAARWLRISPGLIGTTVAAFATSSPELSVAISSKENMDATVPGCGRASADRGSGG